MEQSELNQKIKLPVQIYCCQKAKYNFPANPVSFQKKGFENKILTKKQNCNFSLLTEFYVLSEWLLMQLQPNSTIRKQMKKISAKVRTIIWFTLNQQKNFPKPKELKLGKLQKKLFIFKSHFTQFFSKKAANAFKNFRWYQLCLFPPGVLKSGEDSKK